MLGVTQVSFSGARYWNISGIHAMLLKRTQAEAAGALCDTLKRCYFYHSLLSLLWRFSSDVRFLRREPGLRPEELLSFQCMPQLLPDCGYSVATAEMLAVVSEGSSVPLHCCSLTPLGHPIFSSCNLSEGMALLFCLHLGLQRSVGH